jgi:hypothetical protein
VFKPNWLKIRQLILPGICWPRFCQNGNKFAGLFPARKTLAIAIITIVYFLPSNFSSISGNLNNCLGRRPDPIHPLFLLLQTVCHQFAETLEAHGQCVAELNLTKLEGQCAQVCANLFQ